MDGIAGWYAMAMIKRVRCFAVPVLACATWLVSGANGWGQNVILQRPIPSVVQLPSFQTFSYSGSVLVPDRGATYLGGVHRSATGLNRRRFGRAQGGVQVHNQLTAHATIIDLQEMDRQIRKDQSGKTARGRSVDPVEEGKALVRHARKEYLAGNKSSAFKTYQLAIGVLNGRLQELAKAEFRRVFGSAADQALAMTSVRR